MHLEGFDLFRRVYISAGVNIYKIKSTLKSFNTVRPVSTTCHQVVTMTGN